jgi:hypothetical protein
MRISCSCCVLLLGLWAATGQGHPDEDGVTPAKVTLCTLAEHPDHYAGRMISVRATEMGKNFWIEDFTNKACSAYASVVVVYPEQVKPEPGFDLVRDDAFNKFFEEVRKGMHVEANYEGRFDVAYVWRDHKRMYIGSERGFGKKYEYGARVVLHRLSDVVSHPVPSR